MIFSKISQTVLLPLVALNMYEVTKTCENVVQE